MNNYFLFTFLLLILSCASNIKYGFKEPSTNDSMLVIGRVIVQTAPELDEMDVAMDKIEVTIIGITEQKKILRIVTYTDENGYFAVGDLPKGQYAVKAIYTSLGSKYLRLVNDLKTPRSRFKIYQDEFYPFTADYFPFKPNGRVLSLKHNIFQLENPQIASYPISEFVFFRMKNYELVDGRILNEGPVEEYFIKKYPNSGWKEHLEHSAVINQMRQ